jgi:hypothetical protein
MKYIQLVLLALFILMGSASAQNRFRNQPMRMRVEQAKLQQIRTDLAMDEATFAQFKPLFQRYERALANVDLRNQNRLLNANPDSLTTKEAELLLAGQWVQAKQLIRIRERFYLELRSILTPQQQVRLFQSEADIRQKILLEVGKRQRRGN